MAKTRDEDSVDETPIEHTNDQGVVEWYYKIPIYLKEYGSYVLLAVALTILGVELYQYNQTRQDNALQEAWAKLDGADAPGTANPPEQLRDLVSSVTERPIQAMAYTKIGLFYLQMVERPSPEGMQGVKATSAQALDAAAEAFNKVLNDYADQGLPLAIARMGLGSLNESKGDWDAAQKQYEAVVKAPEDSASAAYSKLAQYRLDHFEQWKQPIVLAKPIAVPASLPAGTLPSLVPSIGPLPGQ